MSSRPSGTVTFLFTDIEGSTRLMERHPEAYRAALDRHHAILREAVAAEGGYVFETLGDGVYVAFSQPTGAVAAAIHAQLALQQEPWGEVGQLKVRMGLHTGEVELWGDHYFGPSLYRCGRLMAVAHGGQVVLSSLTAELVREALPEGTALRALGEHQLRDLSRPEPVFQLLHSDLPGEFPLLRTLQSRPNNLPAQATPFIGREQQVDTVRHRLLRRPDVRLVTLLGPGGAGKTRLALQVAIDSLDDFPDGVFLVRLARIADPDLVAPTIAQALGVREVADRPLLESLTAFLRERRLLLVLDNFEHVVDAAPLVSDLLATCPLLKIMVTSRAVLRIYGEREFRVPPLTLPDPRRLPPAEQLAQYEAVRLFVERAQDITPGFAIDGENARAVAEICHRLDGLPLAIELAAARTRLLSPQAILARLERSLPLLTRGSRDVPARQQTLRDAIAWSYDLLDVAEQSLFRQLAVFVGGCTLEGAEAVCDPTGDPAAGVLDGLESLVAKSLLRQQESVGSAGPVSDGVTDSSCRFSMLLTIREFALERLDDSGERERIQQRHAVHVLAVAERAAPELRGPQQAAWFDRLEQEKHNLRAALRWSIDAGRTDLGLRLAGALWWFWRVHGYLSEGRDWLALLLASPGADTPTAARARALVGLGVLTHDQGGYQTARALLEESVAIERALGERRDLGSALAWLGHVVQQDDPETCRGVLEEALATGRDLGDDALIARSLNNLGELARREGDDARAAALYEESLAVSRTVGHQARMAAALHNLGHLAQRRADAGSAAALFAESLAIAQQLGDQRVIAHCLAGAAGVAALEGQPERAARLFGAAEALLDTLGSALDPADRQAYDHNVAAARTLLDAQAIEAAWLEGRAMSVEQAVAYALTPAAPAAEPAGSRAGRDLSPLTAREQTVAALVAQGLTNREIAAALVITERTAATHVEHILAKLGLRSRAQVAAWVIERGRLSA